MLSARLLWLTAPSSLCVSVQSECTLRAECLFVQDFIRQAAHSAQCPIDRATRGHTHFFFVLLEHGALKADRIVEYKLSMARTEQHCLYLNKVLTLFNIDCISEVEYWMFFKYCLKMDSSLHLLICCCHIDALLICLFTLVSFVLSCVHLFCLLYFCVIKRLTGSKHEQIILIFLVLHEGFNRKRQL